MKKNIIFALSTLAIAVVSCVDKPDEGKFPEDKYYYDIPNLPVTEDYVVGVMYHELNETYWFKSTNNTPNFTQPEGYTGTPLLGDPIKKGDDETNGGYFIGKDFYNGGVIMRQQLDWAKQAGIDFLLFNWNKGVNWDPALKMDTFMLNFKNVWQAGDPKIAFTFDCGHLYKALRDSLDTNYWVPPSFLYPEGSYIGTYMDGRGTKQTFLDQLDSLKTYFFNEDFYYKLPDGRPLLGLSNYKRTNSVLSTIDDVRDAAGNVYLISSTSTLDKGNGYTSIYYVYDYSVLVTIGTKSKNVYLFREGGEATGTPRMPFDAMYQPAMLTDNYSRHGEDNWRRNYFSLVDYNYKEWQQKMDAQGSDYIPCVMPAFDNRENTPDSRIFIHPREPETGELYNTYANVAKRNVGKYRIVLINSWNEFKQGSGLEPTEEYGETYLDFTKKYFKKN